MKFIFKNILKNDRLVEGLKNSVGSTDYKNAGVMRDILVKNVSEDFTEYLPKIACPVFIYWGQKDVDTPLWMAKKMKTLIRDSGLFVVKNGGHFPFLQDNRIISIIDNFARS
jgi:pimeloyl-ACP methyl ester carboxylesterase